MLCSLLTVAAFASVVPAASAGPDLPPPDDQPDQCAFPIIEKYCET